METIWPVQRVQPPMGPMPDPVLSASPTYMVSILDASFQLPGPEALELRDKFFFFSPPRHRPIPAGPRRAAPASSYVLFEQKLCAAPLPGPRVELVSGPLKRWLAHMAGRREGLAGRRQPQPPGASCQPPFCRPPALSASCRITSGASPTGARYGVRGVRNNESIVELAGGAMERVL